MSLNIKKAKHTNGKQGFTLIELSIVLVIIGLIVGGVLVGQDLIKAAEVRATISQIEKYNTAVRTFQGKFGGIPGDITAATATSFGITAAAYTGATGIGDGNGIIQDSQSTNTNTPVGEPVIFWQELSSAGLLDGNLGANLSTVGVTTAAASVLATATYYVPSAKLGRSNYIIVGSDNGINYYSITGLSGITAGAAGTATYTGANYLTPIESYNIDKKVDDGAPNTGTVQARDGSGLSLTASTLFDLATTNSLPAKFTAASTASKCTMTGASSTDTADTYNVVASTGGTNQSCALRLRFN